MKVLFLLLLGICSCQSPSQLVSVKTPFKIHGHRGSRGTHPENSLAAFKEALSSGADFIELDLVLNSQGIPIVSHDPVISYDLCVDENRKPLTKPFPISRLNLAQIKKFQCGGVPHPSFPEQKLEAQSLLTLEEFLQWFSTQPAPQVKLNLETKMGSPKGLKKPSPDLFVEAILKLLNKYQLTDRTVLQSFDFRTLQAAKTKEPKLALSLLFERADNFCEKAKSIQSQMISPEFSLLTEKEVKKCHSLGIEVHPWTLNQESQWKIAAQWKVDGVITDYPRRLKSFLESWPQ